MGAAIYNPANDLVQGIITGEWDYQDYTQNDFPILKKCDALYLIEGWENSVGCLKEKRFAEAHNIPVFTKHWELFDFINRPKILCIIGESGSGKSMVSDYITEKYGIKLIKSYTTRKQRNPEDTGHTFLTDEEFDKIDRDDMVAYTSWGDNRYCCLHSDIEKYNVYVIDESGYSMLKSYHSDKYKVCGIRLNRDKSKRVKNVGQTRVDRDKDKFILYPKDFDYNLNNNKTIKYIKSMVDIVVGEFFYNQKVG